MKQASILLTIFTVFVAVSTAAAAPGAQTDTRIKRAPEEHPGHPADSQGLESERDKKTPRGFLGLRG